MDSFALLAYANLAASRTLFQESIFLFGVDYVFQGILDEISVVFARILGIRAVFPPILHAQITAHLAKLKFKPVKINIL